MPKIRLCHADGSESKFGLAGKLFTIGRAGDNDIVLPDGTSSNYHAVLKITPSGDFSLTDLGSTNHTRVNGKRITTRDLHGGDRILFGDTLAVYESDIAPREDADPDENRPPHGATTRRLPGGDTVLTSPPADHTDDPHHDETDREPRRRSSTDTPPPRRSQPAGKEEPAGNTPASTGSSAGGCLGLLVVALLVTLVTAATAAATLPHGW